MAEEFDFDLAVIGAGPGGYVAAIRASQLGLKVVVAERDKPAGVCGNWGCIPSKTLIAQAGLVDNIPGLEALGVKVDRTAFDYSLAQKKSRIAADRSSRGVIGLLRKNKITLLNGSACLTGPNHIKVASSSGDQIVSATHIIVATGSRPKELSGIPIDEDKILSSNGILALTSLPDSLIILGSGAIGMEFAYIMSVFGVKVTVVESQPRILPLEDEDCVAVVEKAFKSRGVTFITGTRAVSADSSSTGVSLALELPDGSRRKVDADKVLIAVGRVPNTEGIGLESQGIVLEQGFIKVGDFGQTSIPTVSAIGDVVPTGLLAHVASKEAELAVEHLAGHNRMSGKLDPHLIPGGIFCEPQIASFGLTSERAQAMGVDVRSFSFPHLGNGKAGAIDHPEGLVKIVQDCVTGRIVGAHVVGVSATEIIHELLLATQAGLDVTEIAGLIHIHPTMSESNMEAARGLEGWAIHI